MLFNNSKEMFNYLSDYYRKNGGPVEILTYGMYLGIAKGKQIEYKDWSSLYPMESRDFIDLVIKDLKIIVGTSFFMECKPNCKDCKVQFNKVLERHEATAEHLGIDVRYLDEMHMKMYRIGDLVISGGMNLSDSGWIDCCFTIEDEGEKERVKDLFSKLWEVAELNIERFYKK